MTNKKKTNLIFVHSFATNNEILQGLFDFLDDYFNIIPIEIPGFYKNSIPLNKPSFKSVISYVEKKICFHKIDSYWLGGGSMSYFFCKELLKNNMINKNCKGILAIAPYINSNFLSKNKQNKFNIFVFKTIIFLRIYKPIIKSKLFKKFLIKHQYPIKVIEYMTKEMDAKTIFMLAKEVATCKSNLDKLSKPHVILVNKKDDFIDTNKTILEFKKKIKNHLILEISGKHFPENISRKYFESIISEQDMKKVINFVKKYEL